jgi:hypothetical protein
MPNAKNTSPSPTMQASTEEYDIVIIGSGSRRPLLYRVKRYRRKWQFR